MKLHTRTALLAAMALISVIIVFYRLERWTAHMEDAWILLLMALMLPGSITLTIIHVIHTIRTQAWLWLILGLFFAALCFWGVQSYLRIPVCLECNGGVTADDLGWMAPWFYPTSAH